MADYDDSDTNKLINNWIFEYNMHRCFKLYQSNGYHISAEEDENFIGDIEELRKEMDKCDLQSANAKNISFVLYLFIQLLCLECSVTWDEGMIKCDHIADEEDFVDIICKSIVFASRDSENEEMRCLARHCLLQSHVVNCKYSLRIQRGRDKALKYFKEFAKLMPTQENQKMYKKYLKLESVDPEEDFISDYIESMKRLVVSLFEELDDPALIKFAKGEFAAGVSGTFNFDRRKNGLTTQDNDDDDDDDEITLDKSDGSANQASTSSPDHSNRTEQNDPDACLSELEDSDVHRNELDILLRDQRPSKKSDLEEIKREELGISRFRKQFLGFDKERHTQRIFQIEKHRKRRPPSHQTFKVGPWMPEEEKAFVRKTLEIGIGHWKEIKSSLKSHRSAQQLKDKWRVLIKSRTIQEIQREMSRRKKSNMYSH